MLPALWFYEVSGQRFGPLRADVLKKLLCSEDGKKVEKIFSEDGEEFSVKQGA